MRDLSVNECQYTHPVSAQVTRAAKNLQADEAGSQVQTFQVFHAELA